MHQGSAHQPRRRLWLFAGTGEGPRLAEALLALGWRVRVSVVTPAAGRAYDHLAGVELCTGALDGAPGLQRELLQAERHGAPFTLVVDGTHPFALSIRQALVTGCGAQGLPLLRLERPHLADDGAASPVPLLPDLDALRRVPLRGERILLAIGARRLADAVACSPGALHHARLLPSAAALQQAMAAGLAAERVACLRPTAGGAVEEALLKRWGITLILARQSGGPPEALWRHLALRQGCRLLLLRRPPDPTGVQGLDQQALLARLAAWPGPGGTGAAGQDG
ncbi:MULTISPECIES: precorrin-6A/cobalt-precorrin-6A reductase [Aphanothece]|uniref:precorrin-6A/cobalt-precorrin-6A reductase n=1 Tax=Aphanothece TaxID=1121 RepID=UPI00398F2C73